MKRIFKEVDRLIESPPADVKRIRIENAGDKPVLCASIVSNADAFKGHWPVRISFPPEYPYKPPHCQFLEPVPFHPNIDFRNGGVCLDIFNHGTLWSPTFGVERLLLGLISLLDSPNTDHGLNGEAIDLLKRDPIAFTQRALEEARKRRPTEEEADSSGSVPAGWREQVNETETQRSGRLQAAWVAQNDKFERERLAAVNAALRFTEQGSNAREPVVTREAWTVRDIFTYVIVPAVLGALWWRNVEF